jgi:hypothetical protein
MKGSDRFMLYAVVLLGLLLVAGALLVLLVD